MAITEEAHRNIFGALGGAISAAGIVVGADWLASVAGASPDRRLSVNNLIFYFAIFCAVIGALVIAAAVTETKYLPLPGKRPIIQRRQREETNRQLEETKKELDALLKTFALRTLGPSRGVVITRDSSSSLRFVMALSLDTPLQSLLPDSGAL
jgi:MFS family permease